MHKRLVLAMTLAAVACSDSGAAPTPDTTNNSPSTSGGGRTAGGTGTASSAGIGGGSTSSGASTTAGTRAPATGGTSAAAPTGSAGTASGAEGSAGSPAATAGTPASAAAGTGAAGSSGAGGDSASTAGGSAPATGSGTAATSRTFEITKVKVMDAPTFNITRPMDLSALGEQPLPVVVWANGGCVRSDFTWAPLFERWAKAGFVVLSLTGTGGDDDIFGMLSMTSKTEHAQLIDWVIKQNESGEYAGKLDVSKIVIAGNSCGGVTALEVAGSDDRLAAVFVLSGSSAVGSVNTMIMQNVKVPVGYVVGGEEDIAGANASGDYAALKDGIPAMIVHRKEGDHMTVSTDTMILPQDAEIALNWMDLALYGTKAAHDTLTSPDVCAVCVPGDWRLEAKNLETLVK